MQINDLNDQMASDFEFRPDQSEMTATGPAPAQGADEKHVGAAVRQRPKPPTTMHRPLSETQGQMTAGPTPQRPTQRSAGTDTLATQSEPRPRPVFKMRRTGHSGPFPFSGRPALSSSQKTGSGDRPSTRPHPVTPVPLPVIPGTQIPRSESAIGKSNSTPAVATLSTSTAIPPHASRISPAAQAKTTPRPPSPPPLADQSQSMVC